MKIKQYILLCGLLLGMTAAPASAAEPAPESVTFRFLPDDDGFYLSVGENERMFTELLAWVDRHKGRNISVRVEGYSSGLEGREANLASARVRSNRVKSELIVRKGLKEADFVTTNRAEPYGDVASAVVVTMTLPGRTYIPEDPAPPIPPPEIEQEPPHRRPEQRPVEMDVEEIPADAGYGIQGVVPTDYKLAIRLNLLHWATLTPDLGIEWRMGRTFSLLAHGAWTDWSWKDGARSYELWKIAPEFRWYLGLRKQWHLGAQYHYGRYDIMLCDKSGYKGRFQGGSLVGGYQFMIGKRMLLDLTVGVGGTRLNYTKTEWQNGARNPVEQKGRTWWGPNQAAVTLGWRIGK